MGSIVIFSKKLVKGGAEKQALTLARLLAEKKQDVVIVIWKKNKVDPRHLDFISDNALKYYGLEGNILQKSFRFKQILKKEKVSIILAYLTLANFISGLTRLFNKNIIAIGGIRTEKLPFVKLAFEKFVHNHLNNSTIFNNFSSMDKF